MARLQFELSKDRVEELDALVKKTGLKTRVQLFNAALTLFEWAIEERKHGRIIAALDEENGRYKEIFMPGFPKVKSRETKETTEELDEMKAELTVREEELRTAEAALAVALRANAAGPFVVRGKPQAFATSEFIHIRDDKDATPNFIPLPKTESDEDTSTKKEHKTK